jgi:hypothetical protein
MGSVCTGGVDEPALPPSDHGSSQDSVRRQLKYLRRNASHQPSVGTRSPEPDNLHVVPDDHAERLASPKVSPRTSQTPQISNRRRRLSTESTSPGVTVLSESFLASVTSQSADSTGANDRVRMWVNDITQLPPTASSWLQDSPLELPPTPEEL